MTRLLPKVIDNNYQGPKIALYFFHTKQDKHEAGNDILFWVLEGKDIKRNEITLNMNKT